MSINFRMIAFWTTLVLCLSQSMAFWWGRSETPQQDAPNPYVMPSMPVYYQQRLLKTQQHPYPMQEQQAPVAVPAIPIQVPLQAQLAHVPNVHNVQLVPCLCPVTPEDFEKPNEQHHSHNGIKNTV